MRLSTINTTLIIGMTLLLFISCENFLEVNTSPNVPTNVTENQILTGVLARHSYQVIGNWPARHGVKWTQQIAFAGGVPPTWDNYDLTEGGTNASWTFGYANVIKNCLELDQIATKNGNFAYSGIAKILTAWNLSILTDTYGDIPWKEAFDPETHLNPKYDSQQDIYNEIFQLLNAALEDFKNESIFKPGTHDLVYNGNMANWERLAYTLKARYHMRLSNAPGENKQERAQLALNAIQYGLGSNAHNALFQYFTEPGSQNPWYQFAIGGRWDDRDRLSANYVDLLKSLNDPRLPVQARPAIAFIADSIVYRGFPNGMPDGIRNQISQIGTYYSAPDAPLYLLHYPEAKFIEAEATLIVHGAAAADPIYREAIRAHMDKLEVGPSDRDKYIDALPNLGTLSYDIAHDHIMTQKYIANFLSPEVWSDWRRTSYPILTPVTHAAKVDEIPRRFPYPLNEWQYNADNVTATGVPLGYESMKSRVWWDPN